MEKDKYSCVDCIWHDQCESAEPCDFFDTGREVVSLTDDEICLYTEIQRSQFENDYLEYVKEYGDGNVNEQ